MNVHYCILRSNCTGIFLSGLVEQDRSEPLNHLNEITDHYFKTKNYCNVIKIFILSGEKKKQKRKAYTIPQQKKRNHDPKMMMMIFSSVINMAEEIVMMTEDAMMTTRETKTERKTVTDIERMMSGRKGTGIGIVGGIEGEMIETGEIQSGKMTEIDGTVEVNEIAQGGVTTNLGSRMNLKHRSMYLYKL